jgi:tetratricopeptide (TPR) repeat protein
MKEISPMSKFRLAHLGLAMAALGFSAAAPMIGLVPAAYAADTVRAEVGKPLQEAQSLAKAGNYTAALAKVKQADAVSHKTAEEQQIIDQMRNYVQLKSGNSSAYEQMIASGKGNAQVARALAGAHWREGAYKKVIADVPTLTRFGALDSNMKSLVVQAYNKQNDYAGAIKFLQGLGHSDLDTAKLLYAEAYHTGDKETIRASLEQLVLATGDPQYWKGALDLAQQSGGLSDHEMLDILRLRLMTGTMRTNGGASGDDDYSLLSQVAIQLGFPGEAQAVMQKGMDAKVVTGNRAQRLFGLAQKQAQADMAKLAAEDTAASKEAKGDALVKLGEKYWGYGRYQDALNAVDAADKKGVVNKADAAMVRGLANLGLGHRDAAAKAFASAPKGDAKMEMVTHLFNIYARSSTSAKQASNATPDKADAPAKKSTSHRPRHH